MKMYLIDKQAVLNIVMCYCPDDDGSCSKAGVDLREMLDDIESLPAIETEPVRHGRRVECCNELDKKCSCCNKVHGTIYNKEPFCPNCGARMNEKERVIS